MTYASLSKDEGGGALFMMGKAGFRGPLWCNGRFVDSWVSQYTSTVKKGLIPESKAGVWYSLVGSIGGHKIDDDAGWTERCGSSETAFSPTQLAAAVSLRVIRARFTHNSIDIILVPAHSLLPNSRASVQSPWPKTEQQAMMHKSPSHPSSTLSR